MLTAAALARRLLASPAASAIPGIVSGSSSGCSSAVESVLLPRLLDGVPASPSSPYRNTGSSSSSSAFKYPGALDYGLKVLRKHNVYGITPTIGSAHYLLQHAKEHNDTKLMESVMQVLSRNSLPLQPGTADIVFSICYNSDRWDLHSKYAERFVKAGVKLHRTAFDICMEFAAKVGDSQDIWSINSLRGKSVKYYTLATGFACAKGFLLERRPESAAVIIKLLNKHLPEQKKLFIKDKLQKLIAEWPSEVIKRQKKNDRKALEQALVKDIPTMIKCLKKLGLDLPVDLDKLTPQLQAAW